jgi:DNA-binding XRE family transcriptional regulator
VSETNRGKADAAADQREPSPGLDEMIDSGDVDEPVPHGQFLELSALVHELKARREARGLSLTDVSQRSGLTRAAISRLENGWTLNPTLETLYRYALALDTHIALAAEDIEEDTK